MVVTPNSASGYTMSIAQLWGSGPKWAISCGACSLTFKTRLPMVSQPGVKCPGCGAINVIPIEVSPNGDAWRDTYVGSDEPGSFEHGAWACRRHFKSHSSAWHMAQEWLKRERRDLYQACVGEVREARRWRQLHATDFQA